MSTKLSSATALSEVRAASVSGALGVSKGGPQAELGAKVTANAQTLSDRVLYHVYGYNSAEAAKRGEAIPESGPLYQATTGAAGVADAAVTVAASTGDQTWVYVKASGVDIQRGQLVSKTAAGTYDGVAANVAVGGPGPNSPHLIAGVAQHKIPANHYGWLLVKGKGVVNCDAGLALGSSLSPAIATDGVASGLATGPKGIGVSLAVGTVWAATTSDATLALLDI